MKHVNLFESWGRVVIRRRRSILVVAVIGVLFGVVWGTGVIGQLQSAGGFNAPYSASQTESALATSAFGRDAGDVVVLYSSSTTSVHSSAFQSAVTSTLAKLPRADVLSSATYW